MSNYYQVDESWFEKELAAAKKDRESSLDYEKEFPCRVDLVDQFQGHDEDGYAPVRNYKTLNEAVEVARRITEEALLGFGSVYAWHGMGDAGLVYCEGSLVWDGVEEYTRTGHSDEVSRAIDFATKAHQGQCRKGTNIPYVSHPMGVSRILIDRGCPNKLVICGLLHDTLEDTQVTYEDLKREFGLYVAEIVKNLSHTAGDDSWRGKRSKMIEHLDAAHAAATQHKDQYGIRQVEPVEERNGIRSFRLQDMNKVWWEIANLTQKHYDDAFAKGDVRQ